MISPNVSFYNTIYILNKKGAEAPFLSNWTLAIYYYTPAPNKLSTRIIR